MKNNFLPIVFPVLFVSVAAMVFISPANAVRFSSFEEQVDYCHWKYEKYCGEWEEESSFRPNAPPAGGFRNYAPECYQNGLELKDGLEICLAYEESYEK